MAGKTGAVGTIDRLSLRRYGFLLEKNIAAAARALEVVTGSFELLRASPYSCRKAAAANPFLRELLISFGAAGYAALFGIEAESIVSILALRPRREEDYP